MSKAGLNNMIQMQVKIKPSDDINSTAKLMPPFRRFVKKYFCDGQKTEDVEEAGGEEKVRPGRLHHWLGRNRRLVGLTLPVVFFHVLWWPLAIRHRFHLLLPANWPMAITMVFGALVAGATSEGGGAVAFPVMTMALKIAPTIARDFSLMIQTCGMTAAAFTIFWMRLKLEYSSVLYSSIGGVFGLIFGLEIIDEHVSPAQKKMGFVSVFFAFAVALFLLNRQKKRTVFDTIQDVRAWKRVVLVCSGFVGGAMTGLVGSGVDILSFSLLTLLFSVSEKVATPTSIVLMAINTSVGFYWRHLVQQAAWEYMAVCVPIVVICAPLGSLVASHFHRQVLAVMIYVLETVGLVSAFVVIRPSLALSLASLGLMGAFAGLFVLLSWLGRRIIRRPAEVNL